MTEYYYVQNGQKNGPVSADELNNFLASGQLTPNDLIWKSGWAEWKPASTLKSMRQAAANPKIALHQQTQKAAEAADKVSKKLWFLDLKFEQFATPRLIGFVFVAALSIIAVSAVLGIVYALLVLPVLFAILAIAGQLIVSALAAIVVRVALEYCLLGFRITEHLSYLKYLEED